MIKAKQLLYGLSLLLFATSMGCDDYSRTEVKDNIFVNLSSLSPFVGDEIQLVASPTDGTYTYTWLSEHSEVATVSNSGLVNVVGQGFTNIIVKSGALETKVPLTSVVRIPLVDVELSASTITVGIKKTFTVLTINVPENANDIGSYKWYSEDPSIATVDEIGKVTGVKVGETNIVYKVGSIENPIVKYLKVLVKK